MFGIDVIEHGGNLSHDEAVRRLAVIDSIFKSIPEEMLVPSTSGARLFQRYQW